MRIAGCIELPKEMCSRKYLDSMVYLNPAHLNAEKLGVSTDGIDPFLSLYTENDGVVYVPREVGILPQGISFSDLRDERTDGRGVKFESKIRLRPQQVPAVKALVTKETGILEAGCGTGKTVMALDAAARVGRTTLVLVHKGFLLNQWVERIEEHLGEKAGIVRGGDWDWRGHKIVVAMIQTLYYHRENIPNGFLDNFGLVVSDETHRISAPTFSHVIGMFPARRRWGLTATAKRADGLEMVFHAHLGDVLYKLSAQELTAQVLMVKTNRMVPTNKYYNSWNRQPVISKLVSALADDEVRNKKILTLLIGAAKAGRKILLLTDRVGHAKLLKESFELNTGLADFTTALYLGETSAAERAIAVEADVIFATSQMAKEGLDIADLDTLFLVSPSGSEVTIQQSVGRILRVSEGKKSPMVVDFVDDESICTALARKRVAVYSKLGYEVKVV